MRSREHVHGTKPGQALVPLIHEAGRHIIAHETFQGFFSRTMRTQKSLSMVVSDRREQNLGVTDNHLPVRKGEPTCQCRQLRVSCGAKPVIFPYLAVYQLIKYFHIHFTWRMVYYQADAIHFIKLLSFIILSTIGNNVNYYQTHLVYRK